MRWPFRPHSSHFLCCQHQAHLWIAKCQYTEKICASFISVCLYLLFCMSNSWAPNTEHDVSLCPLSCGNEVYCWPTHWHTAVHFFCKRSRLPDEPRNWQKHAARPDTLHLHALFYSCANKCERHSQEILPCNCFGVPPVFMRKSLPALNKWTESHNGPKSPAAADILKREASISPLVFCLHLQSLRCNFRCIYGMPCCN